MADQPRRATILGRHLADETTFDAAATISAEHAMAGSAKLFDQAAVCSLKAQAEGARDLQDG
ncbi:MAG: hypothetical protein ABI692_10130 [Terracoccus sp.]